MSMKIAHEDPEMKVTSSMSSDRGDFSWDARYSTDGKETENQMGPNTSKSVAKWDGVTLTISTKAKFGDNDVTIDDRWTMAEDGKSYTIERKWSSAMGETTQKMVMAKQ
jgi:hypothetical protein